jgi:hypothetical protein
MLFESLRPYAPSAPKGIDLRCCDVTEILKEVRGARLITADPPWRYDQNPGRSNPEKCGIYPGLPNSDISKHLDLSYDCAQEQCRLAVWYTWPTEEEWRDAGHAGPRWGKKKTGGAWTKMLQTSEGAQLAGNHPLGVGHNWRGQTEPVALFVRGSCGKARGVLLNGHVSPSSEHSEKPLEWLRAWVRAWTEPNDLVMDLYAGLAPMARACMLEGRRYIGAEIDPERHRRALVALDKAWKDR